MIKNISYLVLICFFGVLIIALIVLLTGCVDTNRTLPSKPRFSGDHTTANIRGMWHVCYQARLKAMPFILPPVHWEHCDCIVDKSREKYLSTDYDKVGEDNLTLFFTDASIECDLKMSLPEEPKKMPIRQL